MALYFFIHLFTISFPLVRSFENRVNYVSKWKYLFPAIAITATFFVIWDVIFTRNGVWGFNEEFLLGYHFLDLPVEEWLFFITVPFSSVFIYECVLYFVKPSPLKGTGKILLTGFAVLLIILAFVFFSKAYTFWNFLFAGIFTLFSLYIIKPANTDRFVLAYIIHLLPFLLVNGVLTGAFTDEPIVWYNDSENLAVRVFTIPVEDLVYAFLLLFMNISFFEYFRRNKTSKN